MGRACGRGEVRRREEKGADRGREGRTEYHFLDDGKYLKIIAIGKPDKTPVRRHLVLREVRTFLDVFFSGALGMVYVPIGGIVAACLLASVLACGVLFVSII